MAQHIQFFHFDAFAETSSGKKPNIAGVLGEAARSKGFAPHIANPMPPVIHFGCALDAIPAIIHERMTGTKSGGGAQLTARSLSLFTAVVSWPVPREIVESDPIEWLAYTEWRDANVSFFKDWLNDALVSIAEHVDEKFLHLHAYAVPVPKNGIFGVELVSTAHRAQLTVQRAGGTRKEQRLAFRDAARELQDKYHIHVAEAFELARFGPRRKRLSRSELRARDRELALKAEIEKRAREKAIDEALKNVAAENLSLREELEFYRSVAVALGRELKAQGQFAMVQKIGRELDEIRTANAEISFSRTAQDQFRQNFYAVR